jgi:predicted TIM-barrel fold metal-dependent hydrolase
MDQVGPDIVMFSSDFPHIEGGRNPLGRYERNLDQAGVAEPERHKFYAGNFADLLRRPALALG